MSFVVETDCEYRGRSTYPRAGGQTGTQVHLLKGFESAKVACDPQLFDSVAVIPEGTRVHCELDFLATKKGNFLKALSITPLKESAK